MKDQNKQKIKKYKQSKRKTLWTPELHQLFCQTIEQLYRGKIQGWTSFHHIYSSFFLQCFSLSSPSSSKSFFVPWLELLQRLSNSYCLPVTPKYIVKLMNTELKRRKKENYQLTRTQVASHLQQYRQEVTDVLLKQALRDDTPSPSILPKPGSETASDDSLPSFISASQPFEEECLLEDDPEPVEYNNEQLNTYLCMDTSTSPETYVMYSGDNTLYDFLQSYGITCNNTNNTGNSFPVSRPWFATDMSSWVDCP